MKFEDLKFMSIGSNCAPILFLGKNRIRGPIDNMAITDAYAIKFLIENTFFNYICDETNFIITNPKYGKGRPADPDVWFIYKYVNILHNDPRTDKFKVELKKRCELFNSFLANVKTNKNYYFTFCLNEAMVDTTTHKLKDKTLYYICEYLKSIALLDKVIFVQLHADNIAHGGYCNCYINDITDWSAKYNLKVINLYCEDKIIADDLYDQFNTKVKELLNND